MEIWGTGRVSEESRDVGHKVRAMWSIRDRRNDRLDVVPHLALSGASNPVLKIQ